MVKGGGKGKVAMMGERHWYWLLGLLDCMHRLGKETTLSSCASEDGGGSLGTGLAAHVDRCCAYVLG